MSLLEVEGLRVMLPTRSGRLTVVDGIDFHVDQGEVLGIGGESGSGKTMSALALLGILPEGATVEGRALFDGVDLLRLGKRQLVRMRGQEIAMVFQDPTTSLHPMLSIGNQLTEHLRRHAGVSRKLARARAAELLEEVRIPDPERALDSFPHQFSGGMRQRIAIASALICDPRLLIADEPTTALDVTVQAGIIGLLDRLRHERSLSTVIITHDLGVMSAIADRVAVMYAGRVAETGPRAEVLAAPQHPYTQSLLEALPHPERGARGLLQPIAGEPPNPASVPPGCAFHPRCPYAIDTCRREVPPLLPVESREVACPVRAPVAAP